jgi:gliding motility-associated lipoprotein GldH
MGPGHLAIKKFFIAACILLIAVLFQSCDRNRIYEHNVQISDQLWDSTEKVVCEVDVKDTLSPTTFYINVRHADGYPYSNLYMFIRTDFPNGKKALDTLECILADESGKWLGKGLGDIYDCQIPFKRRVRFPMSGKYIFTLQQAMRVDKLPLILDVGLRIEKME